MSSGRPSSSRHGQCVRESQIPRGELSSRCRILVPRRACRSCSGLGLRCLGETMRIIEQRWDGEGWSSGPVSRVRYSASQIPVPVAAQVFYGGSVLASHPTSHVLRWPNNFFGSSDLLIFAWIETRERDPDIEWDPWRCSLHHDGAVLKPTIKIYSVETPM